MLCFSQRNNTFVYFACMLCSVFHAFLTPILHSAVNIFITLYCKHFTTYWAFFIIIVSKSQHRQHTTHNISQEDTISKKRISPTWWFSVLHHCTTFCRWVYKHCSYIVNIHISCLQQALSSCHWSQSFFTFDQHKAEKKMEKRRFLLPFFIFPFSIVWAVEMKLRLGEILSLKYDLLDSSCSSL